MLNYNKKIKKKVARIGIEVLMICKWTNAAHQEALKGEIERLKQMYYQQNMHKKMENGSTATTHHHDSPISDHANNQEQLMIN